VPDVLIGYRSDRQGLSSEGREVELLTDIVRRVDTEIPEAAGDADWSRSEQVLQLAAEGILIREPV